MFNEKWHHRFIRLAKEVSTWSKDPSTQVGATIVNSSRHPMSHGYNGLPARMEDSDFILSNREEKYKHIIHAERNAIDNSTSSVYNCIMYVTHPCCAKCANYIVDSGIKMVVWPHDEEFSKRWKAEEAIEIFKKNNVEVLILHNEESENGTSKES